MNELSIGIGKRCITPPKPELLRPTGMGRLRDTEGVNDDLYTEAMAISAGGESAFLCTLEVRYLPYSWVVDMRRKVARETGCHPERILFSSTHTHSSHPAPADDSGEAKAAAEECHRLYIDETVQACVDARNHMRPAEVAAGSTELKETIGQNRRMKFNNGTCLNCWGAGSIVPFGRKIAHPPGPHSTTIDVMCIREKASTEPFAVFTSYAAHPHMYEIPRFSGEFAGAAKRAIEKRIPGVTAMHANHTGGDIDIHCVHPMPDEHGAQLAWFAESIELLGNRFADAVVPLAEKLEYTRPGKIRHAYLSNENEKKLSIQPGYILNHLLLGDIAFVSIPGELFHCFGKQMHRENPYKHLFLMGYNGSGGMYAPLPRNFEEGSYEVKGGPHRKASTRERTSGPDVARLVRDTLMEMSR